MADSLHAVIQKGVMNIIVIVVTCMIKPISRCTNTEVCEVMEREGVTGILKS